MPARYTAIVLGCVAVLLTPWRAGAISPSPFQFTKETLPVGGTFVEHPRTRALYYIVPAAAIARHRENFGKRQGLYFSPPSAAGKFMIVTDRFDFRQLVINPVTHRLYAHIVWRYVHMGPEKVIGQDRGLIATSDDGFTWKDVTPSETPRPSKNRPPAGGTAFTSTTGAGPRGGTPDLHRRRRLPLRPPRRRRRARKVGVRQSPVAGGSSVGTARRRTRLTTAGCHRRLVRQCGPLVRVGPSWRRRLRAGT